VDEFTLPPSSTRTIGDELLEHDISWRFYGEDWNAYVADPDGYAPGNEYCNICNFRSTGRRPTIWPTSSISVITRGTKYSPGECGSVLGRGSRRRLLCRGRRRLHAYRFAALETAALAALM
jgi:hypothetical protein